ncbi:DNA processing protein DprA [Malaciobacter halophilus]|uniref:DNA processing protein DprA n=1 Tax=Malaciobacter halophilus TaxID=197482 RepID=A0A2N1J5D8_9BACT|nr:DNA-processing protein DprA [Malaciobacter halophilus]AXH10723.1 DNA protecting protein DprA [Malaciobacter halophilus]PKI81746.1 DNA processing protein DprA [Malaciobacter halophilus]
MTKTLDFHIKKFDCLKTYPNEIYYRGNLDLLNKNSISIVGTRRPINYTKQLCYELASKLSNRGICIVSGGAMGVDAIAHQGAGFNNTISILANGLNIKYPKVNKNLLTSIENQGLLLSTYKDNFKATKYTFVHRNELVVALSDTLVIMQADENSGSIRSLEYALKMNKKIYTISHRANDNKGLIQYIKKGLVEVIYDVDEFVNSFKKEESKQDDEILTYLKTNPTYEEALLRYNQKIFEYELNSIFKVENGVCIVI